MRNCTKRILSAALSFISLLTVSSVYADKPYRGAGSVAEMLERRQESRLREQLVQQGRSEEVQRLDEFIAQRDRAAKTKVVTLVNADLVRASRNDVVALGAADICDRETLRVRHNSPIAGAPAVR